VEGRKVTGSDGERNCEGDLEATDGTERKLRLRRRLHDLGDPIRIRFDCANVLGRFKAEPRAARGRSKTREP
jgi:hypothetical protein